MANFAAYQSRGQLAAPQEHYTKPVGLSYDNPGERALAREGANMAGVFIKGYENWKEQYDSGKVMEANNEYNRLMSEGTAELMQKKQENALNIVQDYDKLHQKVLDQVRKKFGAFINYGKAGQAFNIYTERDNNTRRNNMMKYQIAETEAYHETQFNNQVLDCEQNAIAGGSSNEAIMGGLNRLASLIADRYGQYGKEKMIEQQTLLGGKIVTGAIDSVISMGDYDRAGQILRDFKQYIPPKVYVDTMARVHKQQEIKRDYITVDDITRQCRDANGSIDLARAREVLEKMYGPDAVKQGGGGVDGNARAIYERFKDYGFSDNFIAGVLGRAQQEHNFDTSDVPISYLEDGTEVGGYGMFQWTKGRRERLLNWAQENGRDPQDAYAQAEFALIEAEERGITPDKVNHLSHEEAADLWTDKWEVGERGSEREYAGEWLQRIQQPGSAFDPEKLEKMYKMVEHKANEEKVIDQNELRSIRTSLMDAALNGGGNLNELADQLSGGKSYYVQVEAQKLADSLIRSQERGASQSAKRQPSTKVDDTDMDLLRDEISKGVVSETDIINYCTERGITSQKEINKCLKLLRDYMDNKGEWAIPYDDIKAYCDIDERMIEDKKSFNKTFKRIARFQYYKMLADNKGQLFSGWEEDLADRVAKAFTEEYHGGQYVDKGTWMNTEENVILPYRILAANGYDTIRQTGDDGYVLESADGKYAYMSGEDIMKMKDLSGYRR